MVNDTRAEYDHLQTLSDEALCALVKQGSRDAEEILVGRYHRLVRSCARPYFLAGGDSEDLLQEGMFGLIKAILQQIHCVTIDVILKIAFMIDSRSEKRQKIFCSFKIFASFCKFLQLVFFFQRVKLRTIKVIVDFSVYSTCKITIIKYDTFINAQ